MFSSESKIFLFYFFSAFGDFFLDAERDREREADCDFSRSSFPFLSLLVRPERLRSRGESLRRR